MKPYLFFLFLWILDYSLKLDCPDKVQKTIYQFSIDTSQPAYGGNVLVHADTNQDGKPDFDFMISADELKDIFMKNKLPWKPAEFESIDKGAIKSSNPCVYTFIKFLK